MVSSASHISSTVSGGSGTAVAYVEASGCITWASAGLRDRQGFNQDRVTSRQQRGGLSAPSGSSTRPLERLHLDDAVVCSNKREACAAPPSPDEFPEVGAGIGISQLKQVGVQRVAGKSRHRHNLERRFPSCPSRDPIVATGRMGRLDTRVRLPRIMARSSNVLLGRPHGVVARSTYAVRVIPAVCRCLSEGR